MCGRFTLFTEKEEKELYRIIQEVDNKLKQRGAPTMNAGEIYPTHVAPIMIKENGVLSVDAAIWGFPQYNRNGVIINARAETAAEKPMFSEAFYTMRCGVPSAGFYEWDKSKNKYFFKENNAGLVFMAGLASVIKHALRFVILTTEANASMKGIHSRMPVTMQAAEIERWIFDESFAKHLLQRVPSPLEKHAEGGQMSFASY